jgi:cytochrome c oxidase assembly protein subunit 15
VPETTLPLVRRLALASIVANIAIVVTGGAVRLTASGLGCPTWPRCTDDSLVTTPENGIHGYVEFGNRLLTFVLAAVAVATLVAALGLRPRHRHLSWLALVLLLGIPAQAIIGGITVLTELNPWVVMLHFLCSMVLIGLATVLHHRTADTADTGDTGDTSRRVHPLLRRLGLVTVGVLAVVLYLGTVVTGSGPHAGDAGARRTGLDPQLMSQLHADGVFLLVGLSVALLVALHAAGAPGEIRRAAAVLVGIELTQGAIGYTQYFTGLPVALVNLHLLGAGLLVVAAVRLVLTMRTEPGPSPEQQRIDPYGQEEHGQISDRAVEQPHRAQRRAETAPPRLEIEPVGLHEELRPHDDRGARVNRSH